MNEYIVINPDKSKIKISSILSLPLIKNIKPQYNKIPKITYNKFFNIEFFKVLRKILRSNIGVYNMDSVIIRGNKNLKFLSYKLMITNAVTKLIIYNIK
ncbi:hypothetical protein [Chryseobacterium sp.]|uniref:hypothetical protein n=1 Tax=Chryseobacterium sp. TaxID=1871047 RepID=UPI002FC68F2E